MCWPDGYAFYLIFKMLDNMFAVGQKISNCHRIKPTVSKQIACYFRIRNSPKSDQGYFFGLTKGK